MSSRLDLDHKNRLRDAIYQHRIYISNDDKVDTSDNIIETVIKVLDRMADDKPHLAAGSRLRIPTD